MKFKVDHDLHIHSYLSECSSDPEQNTSRILKYGCDNGYPTLALTDHYWDENIPGASEWYAPQNTANLKKALPLPNHEGINFLFGCETELRKDLTLGISEKNLDLFDFIIIPTTHLHMRDCFTIDVTLEAKERAELYVKRLEAVLNMNLPFHKIGIAHLACKLVDKNRRPQDVLSYIKDETLLKLFDKAAKLGVGIEINGDDANFKEQPVERADSAIHLFELAKKAGCKFYFGSDAHHPDKFDKAKAIAEYAVDVLNLKEEDKFVLKV